MCYRNQHHVDADSSAEAATAMMMMSEVYPMRKVHTAASVAGSHMQNSTAETVCGNNNGVEDDDDGANDDNDGAVVRCNSSSSSSSSTSSNELYITRRRLITGKDAQDQNAQDWLSLASSTSKDHVTMHNADSEAGADGDGRHHAQDDNVSHQEREDSGRVDDDTDCSCWNDVRCTPSEV